MTIRRCIVVVAMCALPSGRVSAQSCPPPPPSSGGKVYFEFQVETPARFVGDTASRPVPDQADHRLRPYPPDFAVVQFVVDTNGAPSLRTMKMLIKPDSLAQGAVESALPRWRFTPAKVAGCKVPQLVQTPLRWR